VVCVSALSVIHVLPRSCCVGAKAEVDLRDAGVDLDSMSEAQLESLYAGLVRMAALRSDELQILVQDLLAEKDEAHS
jgi:hypothetical protein